MMSEKLIEISKKNQEKLAVKYNVPISAIVWMGNDKYIIVKNGKEIRVTM